MKKQRMELLTKRMGELGQEKAGAQALAKEKVDQLRAAGKTDADIMADGEVIQYQAAFTDAASTLAEKNARIADLEADMENLKVSVDQNIAQAQSLAREVEQLRSEKHEAVASIAASQQIDKINEALAGVSSGGADETLQRLRQQRQEAEGRARAATKIAGTDTKLQREKLRQAAIRHTQSADFLNGIGLGTSTPASTEKSSTEAPQNVTKLPEEE